MLSLRLFSHLLVNSMYLVLHVLGEMFLLFDSVVHAVDEATLPVVEFVFVLHTNLQHCLNVLASHSRVSLLTQSARWGGKDGNTLGVCS